MAWRFLWWFYCNFFKFQKNLQMYFNCLLGKFVALQSFRGGTQALWQGSASLAVITRRSLFSSSAICNHIASLRKSKTMSFVEMRSSQSLLSSIFPLDLMKLLQNFLPCSWLQITMAGSRPSKFTRNIHFGKSFPGCQRKVLALAFLP